MKCRKMVDSLPCGKVVAGDGRRRDARSRGLPRKNGSMGEVLGGGGIAFLRESHAGYKAPPALCQEPAFESTTSKKKQIPNGICFFLVGGGGFEPPKS